MADIPPEVQAQLEEQKKNCPFCKIISGEIPSKKVFDDGTVTALLDINPCVKGHMLVMPDEHYPILPFLPYETFTHTFGLLPRLSRALKDAMLATGINIVISNGGVAGQQSPHFLFHMIPREKGDMILSYDFTHKKEIDTKKAEQIYKVLQKNLPVMLKNHFNKHPASWHKGKPVLHDSLKDKHVLYYDEKSVCVVPDAPQCPGHVIIYPNSDKQFEDLDDETSSHLFYTASFAATAVFETLKAQGSNIILASGLSDDNPDSTVKLHVLPRFPDDSFDTVCPPMKSKPDMDEVAKKITDETFMIKHEKQDQGEKTVETRYDTVHAEINDAITRLYKT